MQTTSERETAKRRRAFRFLTRCTETTFSLLGQHGKEGGGAVPLLPYTPRVCALSVCLLLSACWVPRDVKSLA